MPQYADDELSLGFVQAVGEARPKTFRVKIHTGDVVDVTAGQLMSFAQFNKACAEQVGRIFRPPGCAAPAGTGSLTERWQREVIAAQRRGE